MDIRQLKAFVAVFEERSITLAAQRLFVTQPTLSVTIRQLEDELGVSLFERQPRGVDVSENARLLYPQARRMLAQAQALAGMFRQRRDCLPLCLGVDGDVSRSHLEALLARAARAEPAILLETREGCCGDARLAAEDGRCEDELFLPLWEENFVLAVPAGHRLAARDQVDMALLDEPDWIVCPDHPSHQRLLDLHGAAAPALATAARAGSLRLAAHMAAAGLGVALLPASLANDHPGLEAIPLSGATPYRRVGLCHAPQALELPALQALKTALEDYSGSGADSP
ncbi:DNA-binding transcriptional regulator, LysR family [Chromobacterium violaceum]|nr:LysR family transcriptional regulator [Chromobacterium violaceum]AAQ60236.1 probable peroxide-inducible genes activator [Chromobacterium violaceum ATCC 12472]MBX9266783.1 LysR family transcriptional regulator [Chromobacterium violaceum]OQS48931.1 LysR family transcriptional regulator [Chromobacterium violaceum]OQS51456.1 LysR family transcriptional regulator [Chromobacterium violaceum]QRO33771.1 LysR family transcriptional regulator [Chromobacterium violaceum]